MITYNKINMEDLYTRIAGIKARIYDLQCLSKDYPEIAWLWINGLKKTLKSLERLEKWV